MENILQKSIIIYRKNSVQRNAIYGKDCEKIRHHLWEKNLYKTNTIYEIDTAKIRHHICKRLCKNQTSSTDKIL